jgi:hypothetical protein
MAIINGAKSLEEIKRTVKGGFFSVIRVCSVRPHIPSSNSVVSLKITWVASPLTMMIAQNFIPVEVRFIV